MEGVGKSILVPALAVATVAALATGVAAPLASVLSASHLLFRPESALPDPSLASVEAAAMTLSQFALHRSICMAACALAFRRMRRPRSSQSPPLAPP